MKLLIITQAVDTNDQALGFFHDWLQIFSEKVERVTVLCLKRGVSALPDKVKIISLGKEVKESRIRYIFNFYRTIFVERRNYDTVFVHMNPEYVVLGGIFWRLMGKKIVLWYTHRQVTFRLRVATFFANTILTAADESFKIKSSKVRVVGHGIDVERFTAVYESHKVFGKPLRLISVGRITRIKNIDILIEAVSILVRKGIDVRVRLLGGTVTKADLEYFKSLKELVSKLSLSTVVEFPGKIPNEELPLEYKSGDISVNLTPTGGIDKAVLESMASGALPLSSNTAFKKYFGTWSDLLIFKERDALDLAGHIEKLLSFDTIDGVRSELKAVVEAEGSAEQIVEKIVSYL